MAENSIEHDLNLVAEATQRLLTTLNSLTDEQARQASGLPGWTRGHLVTHIARNADGMCNLLAWARTGVVTPMYREPDGRDADIEAGSTRPAAALVADVRESDERWARTAAELTEQDWQSEIRRRSTMAPESARNLVSGRLFEVEFHHVDLDLGYGFAQSPAELVHRALNATRRGKLAGIEPFQAILTDALDELSFGGTGKPELEVHGTATALLGWLTGRSDGADLSTAGGELPTLPAW